MATTTRGLHYPAGSDAPSGATQIQTLAEDVDTALGDRMVVVAHGSTGSTARPTGAAAVYWIGSATPANAATGDLWWAT